MKNSMDFSKIEVNGKLLGVLNFNLMIPIEEEQLQHVDTTIFNFESISISSQFSYVLCYNVLCNFVSLIFSLVRARNVLWEDIINFNGKLTCDKLSVFKG